MSTLLQVNIRFDRMNLKEVVSVFAIVGAPAGWISWAVGFYLGAIGLLAGKIPALEAVKIDVPCPAMAALIAGFVLYLILAKAGLQSKTLDMPVAATE